MGRPPAYLHGYRLDAADKQWHMSSPTPYDPPLTYSGWQQAKSLGVRIASIIRERVHEDAERAASEAVADPSVAAGKKKTKRYKVVLHSSPFLRCVQTSIAICAGLAQDSTPFGPAKTRDDPRPPTAAPGSQPKPTVLTDSQGTGTPAAPVQIRRSVLRLDAFLGEWLSPDYFEFITPPPESVMMLASAKADLLRREDYTHYPNFISHSHSNSQGQLWSPTARANSVSPLADSPSSGGGSAGGLANSLPAGSGTRSWENKTTQPQPARPGYVSPVPHYAVGNNNTIPPGYVSHARDACVMVDYQWHSTRGSLDWGMAGRFRKSVTKTAAAGPADEPADGDEDVETEAVVILVSHGAGCNALIGALTHQPVLMDVGMASLTMAVRKPTADDSASSSSAVSTGLRPVHELYDIKLFANTDHLRSPGATPASPRVPSMSAALNGVRGRHSSFSTIDGLPWNRSSENRNASANTALNSLRQAPDSGYTVPRISLMSRSYGTASGGSLTSSTSTRPSNPGRTGSGLWSPSSPRDEDEEDEPMFPNFDLALGGATSSSTKAALSPGRGGSEADSETNKENAGMTRPENGASPDISTGRSPKPEPEQLGAGAGGLWGIPRPPDDADRLRDLSGVKRRWTVTERS
ncbi:5dd05ef1-45f9-4814-80d3-6b0a95d9dc35 [Thermothielavioides terrestris]|uniref:5dd05ef1-45f9-4814-80d3-6b0a95d9dc35 n=1 Tax=Thermothielavioides terrestris TaxID=2587410 RepID=A0A446BCH0_9PEZI|nr:5dd05ef1-45f9-4814-80d3-6b0a95d9dc35 [Thermothielavioides terrestris]